jgi:hypothetical protein
MPYPNLNETAFRQIISEYYLKCSAEKMSSADGLIPGYEKAALKILEELLGQPPEKYLDGRLSGMVKARVRLAYFSIFNEQQEITDRRLLIYLLFIYEQWMKAFEYLRDNYNELPDENFRQKWAQDDINAILVALTSKFARSKLQVGDEGRLVLVPEQIQWAEQLIDVSFLGILGDSLFEEFKKHINLVITILNEYQQKLSSSWASCLSVQ